MDVRKIIAIRAGLEGIASMTQLKGFERLAESGAGFLTAQAGQDFIGGLL